MDRSVRTARAAIVVFAGLALAAWLAAMFLYPGGTQFNPAAPGHSFWLNYLCDLSDEHTWSGAPNPRGSLFGRAAMIAITGALAALFWFAPTTFGERSRLAPL